MAEKTHSSVDQTENRLEFESLISDTSAALLAAPPEQIDRAVEHALSRVRTFFRADRCALLSVSPDQQTVHVALASYGEGVSQVPADLNLTEVFPWSYRTLLVERAPVCVSTIDDLPPDEVVERESWKLTPIRSALTLPIETAGRVGHLIVLNTVFEEREWPFAFVARLRVLGEMLVGAIERQAMFSGLREAEERMSVAADAAEAGLWTLDYGTGVFWATHKARAMFGYGPDEVITLERFESTVHPEDRGLVRDVLARAASSGGPIDAEYRIVVEGGGGVKWIASRGRPRMTASGEPESLMGVSIDVSDRKRVEQSLQASEARLTAGAELASLAFYEVDFRDGVMHVDARLRDLCGISEEHGPGIEALEIWRDRLHPEDFSLVMREREELHRGAVDRLAVEYRFLHPSRGEIWIQHLAGVSARDDTGRAVVTYGVLRDITPAKRTEDKLRDVSRRLIRAHEEERALLARELHDDVTQRLAVLAIDVGRAELEAPADPQAASMRTVREGLVELSEDIHALAYQLHPSVLDELGLAEALRADCERRRRHGDVELTVDLDPLPVDIDQDTALCLFRVVQEALNNVARHAGARSASVTLRNADGGLRLEVRDDGVGFDLASQALGLSLGLVSMRERVELVNGRLDIETAPGKGTAIIVRVSTEGVSR